MNSDTQFTEYSFRGRALDLARPKIIGILNTTPDSFFDGGLFLSAGAGLDRIAGMIEEGADIIDVGGESTRPGADSVSAQEELDRVLPILERAVPEFGNLIFSIDTTKYEVAKAALELGVHIVNDVSGLQKDPQLATLCGEYNAGYFLMHSKGDPKVMQKDPQYHNVIAEVKDFFRKQLKQLNRAGVNGIVLDPGIGFGKTLAHNLAIVSGLDKFSDLGYPLLAGASRKSVVGQILEGRPAEDRLTGTVAIHYHCMLKGARLLRVHDIKEAKDSVRIFNAVQAAQP